MSAAGNSLAAVGESGPQLVRNVDLRLRRCRTIGCESMATPGGYCLRCAEELVGLQQTEASRLARARIKSELRPPAPRSNRKADVREFLAFLGVVVLTAAFLWITWPWWAQVIEMWFGK